MDLSIAAILAQDGITNGAVYALLAMALVLVVFRHAGNFFCPKVNLLALVP